MSIALACRSSAAAQVSEHTMRCEAEGFAQTEHNALPHHTQTATASALWVVHFTEEKMPE
jgi:hypothetical protein